MSELPPLPTTFRPVVTRVVLLTTGIGAFAALTAVALLLPLGAGERATFFLTAVAFLGGTGLLSRPRISADDHGLTVVNLTTTRRLEWAQVLAVNLRPGDPWVYLDLADGTVLAAMGIQPGMNRRRARAQARALRALVERRGSAPGADA